jgi:transaldolase
MDAFQDHGPAVKVISSEDLEDAAGVLRSLNELGINYEEVVDRLENQGVAAFINAWRTLLEDIDGKRRRIAGD